MLSKSDTGTDMYLVPTYMVICINLLYYSKYLYGLS